MSLPTSTPSGYALAPMAAVAPLPLRPSATVDDASQLDDACDLIDVLASALEAIASRTSDPLARQVAAEALTMFHAR